MPEARKLLVWAICRIADAKGHGQGQREQNREGMQEGLELRRQHHIHEDEGQRYGHDEVVRRASQLFALSHADAGVSRIHVQVLREVVQLGQNVGLRPARQQVGADGHLTLPVEAIDARRRGSRLDADHLIQAHRTAFAR
jgi:hypothetical protein